MSEFLAEARVLIRPDTTRFRRELEAELAIFTGKPVVVPVHAQLTGTAAASTQEFAASQKAATASVLGLQSGLELENSLLAQNAVLLNTDAAAAESDAAALRVAGAARTQAAVSAKALATQQELAATTTTKLALAQEAVAGASSAVAAAQVQFTRASAASAAAEAELAAALKLKNIALIDAAAQSVRVTAAYEAEALAALNAARAEATHARSLGSVGTAAIANSASLLGLRGAVLTAGAAFLGATVAFQSVAKSIKAASDATEEFNKSSVVFGDSAQQIQDFAKSTATSLGISNVEALRAAGIFGNLFRSVNIVPEAAAAMSEALVRLSADLASFNNADPTIVLQNIRSGLAGEAEPLRKFGIFLSETRVQQEALIATGKKQVTQLTQAEKVQARYNLILRDGAIAQGDFANTSESLANQQRILTANLQDLGAELGSVLIPVLRVASGLAIEYAQSIKQAVEVTKDLADAIPGLGANIPGTNTKFETLAKNFVSFSARNIALGPVLGTTSFVLKKLGDDSEDTGGKVEILSDALDAGARAARLAAFAIVSADKAVGDLGHSLDALEVERLKIQTGLQGGGRAAEIANLKAQIATDKAVIEQAKSGTKARRDALEELKRDQADLAALEKEISSESEEAANDRRDAAEKARQSQEEADRAFLDLLGQRREDQNRRISAAGETATLQDDIRAQNSLQALIQQQIKKIRERVKDEQARKDAIRELRIALISSRAEEARLREEQKKQAKEQASTILDLRIQTAEVRGQVALEKRLLNLKIRQLKARIKAAKGDRLLQAQLRLELAQTQKELQDLKKQQEKNNDAGRAFAEATFKFLQTQQGFAANLLGNLIPGGMTGGLVGGAASGGRRPVDIGAGPQDRVNQAAAVGAARDRGVRPIQVDTTNQLLRRILRVLENTNGRLGHPEARYQQATSHGSMDTVPA